MKKHEDFDRAIGAQEEKIVKLSNHADELINKGHYDTDGIENKKQDVLDRSEYVRVSIE